jgi:predicted ATPase
MNVIIGVENYGKIKRAEIMLGDLTVFVGDNNSGKTLMMQLIYGVLNHISRNESVDIDPPEIVQSTMEFDTEWIRKWQDTINVYLEKEKERIVEEIFHNPVAIEKLYIRIDGIDVNYKCLIWESEIVLQQNKDESERRHERPIRVEIERVDLKTKKRKNISQLLFGTSSKMAFISRIVTNYVGMYIFGRNGHGDVFLPASRTGILLLYKYFFAEKDKQIYDNIMPRKGKSNTNELGLTAPVYDFLQFLLRFTPDNDEIRMNRDILSFIETHLLEGKLENAGEDTYYIAQDTEQSVPLYMSSSLINELAPIVKVLSGLPRNIDIFYDEVETCLHPLKQGEMARLIVRLVNSGKRMIISTHSDTMAAKLNNLILLSMGNLNKDEQREKLEKIHYEKADILHTRNVHFYQFKNDANGMSSVEEMEFDTNLGYDFSLFMQNLSQLTEETETVME